VPTRCVLKVSGRRRVAVESVTPSSVVKEASVPALAGATKGDNKDPGKEESETLATRRRRNSSREESRAAE